jgi:DNA polymerase III subunit alpha
MAAAAVPVPICRAVDAARLQPTVIDELRDLFERYPGDAEFVLEMYTRAGVRRLRFGDGYKIAGRNGALSAELDRLLGPAPAAARAAAA